MNLYQKIKDWLSQTKILRRNNLNPFPEETKKDEEGLKDLQMIASPKLSASELADVDDLNDFSSCTSKSSSEFQDVIDSSSQSGESGIGLRSLHDPEIINPKPISSGEQKTSSNQEEDVLDQPRTPNP